ncbi:MAG: hypothetical protein LC099_03505 [Anaerolineales bacterium]|nr:hypothetical protein [Anaerolineales bacterium]
MDETPITPDPYSSSPMQPEPKKKNNTVIIIVAVVVVLLCCCCIFGALGWNYGDSVFQYFNGY